MQKIIDYIIRFLLPENEELAGKVGYTDKEKDFENFSVIICPSDFFDKENYGKKEFFPKFPLQKIENTEILFGTPEIEQKNGKIFVKADIVASSFFLLSRYEEWLCADVLDNHLRFCGKKSLQYRAVFLQRPIVDEYAVLLRKWLKMCGLDVNEPIPQIKKIYLTHDIDFLTYYRHFRGFLGGLFRINFKDVIRSLSDINKDTAYTFPFLAEQDNKIENAEKIYFVKAAKNSKNFDYPQYNLCGKSFHNLAKFLQKNGCKIGLHSSYNAFSTPQEIENEQIRLSKALQQNINLHRTHYLRILPPHQPNFYIKAGITDDFTLGFADTAGFRLGTCRPVRWLNPQTLEIENITLHPLTIMECTLSNENYMNLDFESAFAACKSMIAEVQKHNGELVLLWHNTSVAPNANFYHIELYKKIIKELKTKS